MTLLLKKKMRCLYNHLVVALVVLGVRHCKIKGGNVFPRKLDKNTHVFSQNSSH